MTYAEFIDFLKRLCAEEKAKRVPGKSFFSDEMARVMAFEEIGTLIEVYLENHCDNRLEKTA